MNLDLLKKLLDTPSPPGFEKEIAEIWLEAIRPYADDCRTDLLGNAYALLNPDAERRIMLAGHLDEIGFIVHHIDERGLLYFKAVGGHDPVVVTGQRVRVHTQGQGTVRSRVAGVIGRKAHHLLEDDDELKQVPEIHKLWIDIGVRSKAEAEALVRLGDPVTYQAGFQELENGRAVARGFDNRLGAFVVAEAMRLLREQGGPPEGWGVVAVGTVQEEIGYRGATTGAYTAEAQIGIAVDVSHATDVPGIDVEKHGDIELGKGPTITRGAYVHTDTTESLLQAAERKSIPVQIEVAAECTGTDATPMQVTRGGMAVGLVGIPLRYMHTPCELADLKDVEAAAELIAEFCKMPV